MHVLLCESQTYPPGMIDQSTGQEGKVDEGRVVWGVSIDKARLRLGVALKVASLANSIVFCRQLSSREGSALSLAS